MGMYDNVICEYPLPATNEIEGILKDREFLFQTKSLDCCLDFFKIDAKGQLWREQRHDEWVDDENGCHMVNISKEWVPDSRYATIFLYDWVDEGDNAYSIEFIATIVEGKLKNLVLKDFSKIMNWRKRAT